MTNGRIAVLCPTRDRPGGLRRLAGSVMGTSTKADLIFYADDDQFETYHGIEKEDGLRGRVRDWYGPRIGPAPAANVLAQKFPEYTAFGLITDDSIVTTPGWDRWVLELIDAVPGRAVVISPARDHGEHVDMPFVSKEWIGLTGWYACPFMKHYCWPIVTGLIGEMTAIVHAPVQSFHIRHDYQEGTNQTTRDEDAIAFFRYVSTLLPTAVTGIRRYMELAQTVSA